MGFVQVDVKMEQSFRCFDHAKDVLYGFQSNGHSFFREDRATATDADRVGAPTLSEKNNLSEQTGKITLAVREAGVSRHNGSPITGSLKPLRREVRRVSVMSL